MRRAGLVSLQDVRHRGAPCAPCHATWPPTGKTGACGTPRSTRGNRMHARPIAGGVQDRLPQCCALIGRPANWTSLAQQCVRVCSLRCRLLLQVRCAPGDQVRRGRSVISLAGRDRLRRECAVLVRSVAPTCAMHFVGEYHGDNAPCGLERLTNPLEQPSGGYGQRVHNRSVRVAHTDSEQRPCPSSGRAVVLLSVPGHACIMGSGRTGVCRIAGCAACSGSNTACDFKGALFVCSD